MKNAEWDCWDADGTLDHIEFDDLKPCWHCGKGTYFVEVNFESRLHPGVCTEAKRAEYWQSLRNEGLASTTLHQMMEELARFVGDD